MSGHYIEKCKWCGTVIGQCRCADPDKPITLSVCKECQSHPVAPVYPLELKLTEYGRGWREGFLAGRREQVRVDWERVANCESRGRDIPMHEQIENCGIRKALAALREVAPKED